MLGLLRRLRTARAVSMAVAARREGRWLDAAAGYEAASRSRPGIARFHIQAGHMRKEGGDYIAAERHYEAAARLLPDDAELALQFGHFYNVTGRLIEADFAYRRAARLRTGWDEARRALEQIEAVTTGLTRAVGTVASDDHALTPADVFRRSMEQRLLPEYLPTDGQRPLPVQGVRIRRLGRFDRSAWATARTLQGIEAIMAHCVTVDPVDEVRILLNGRPAYRFVPHAHAIEGAADTRLTKYAFNLWLDLSDYAPGRYHLEIAFDAMNDTPEKAATRSFQDYVTILPPDTAPVLPGSEVWVPPVDPHDPRALDEQINARPSVVRHAPSRMIEPPRAILVLRTDQLGDLSISVPALRRLRELAPAARIVGLLTAANIELAQALGLFDEVIVADFPDIPAERQRVMTVAEQERLSTLLRNHHFDAAIDLAPSHVSRNLLLLAGAKMTMGFGRGSAPWLGAAFDFDVQDARGQTSILPSPAKTLALIEAFGTLFTPVVPDEPATTDPAPLLAALGVAPGERFVVLHDGARIAFSRWPAYPALAEALIARHGVKVVLLTDRDGPTAELPEPLRGNPRFVLLDRRLAFAELDALVSGCALFVGNDTGPKHLAALRGAPIVSIHSARANWGEWGQAGRGAIITRQIPCAACHIYNEAEECTRSFVCVTAITVEEVIAVAADYL